MKEYLTRIQIKKMIELLGMARFNIETQINDRISYALQSVDYETKSCYRREIAYLTNWVTYQLSPYYVLETWVSSRYLINERNEKYRQQSINTRLAWIDWMIAELAKEL